MTAPALDLGGVIVATTLPFREDASAPAGLAVDYDSFAEHCDWLIDNGCRGVGPNGSLGEYSSLTDDERRKVVQVAVEAVGGRGLVIAGVHGVGWHQARQVGRARRRGRRRRRAAAAADHLPGQPARGASSTTRKVDEVGLPIMVYNNPIDTKVDLTPDLVAELAQLAEHRCRQGVLAATSAACCEIQRALRHRRHRRRRRPAVRVAGGRRDRLVRRLPERLPARGRGDLRPASRPGGSTEARDALRAPGRRSSAGTPDRVRPGDQALDRHGRRELRRPDPAAARAADRGARGAGARATRERALDHLASRRSAGRLHDADPCAHSDVHRGRLPHRGDADPRRHGRVRRRSPARP